jgi:hypothetical protein
LNGERINRVRGTVVRGLTAKRVRRLAVALTGAALLGCGQDVTAPGVCPEFCPPVGVQVVDSIMPTAADSTFNGYVSSYAASALELIAAPGGFGVGPSRGVIRFFALRDSLRVNAIDTVLAPIASTDSFAVQVDVLRRRADAKGIRLGIYRLPTTVDSTATYAQLEPYFQDSTLIGTIALDDTLQNGLVSTSIPASAFPGWPADSFVVAVGVAVLSPDSAWVNIGAVEAGSGAQLSLYVHQDSSGTSVPRQDSRLSGLDMFVAPPPVVPPAGVLAVGGSPSSRVLMHLDVPSAIVDSSSVVRATLLLVPSEPVIGGSQDTVAVIAHALTADFGPKSPLILVPADSIALRAGNALVGTRDTVRVDLTDVLRVWHTHPELPHTIILRATPEGATGAAVRFGTSAAPSAKLEVTYIPPYKFRG